MKRERINWGARVVLCVGFLLLLVSSGRAQVSNVDLDLQEIYEHYEGVSLATAIQQLEPRRSLGQYSPNNVIVRFNGGGIDDRLYIGRNNTLEVLVTNNLSLGGFTLGLQLECDNCSFEWVEGYGTLPPETDSIKPVHEIVRVEEPGIQYWIQPIGIGQDTTSILLGGADGTGGYLALPQNSTELLLYSMQIYIPEGTQEDQAGFHIDNILFPPAGTWTFTPTQPDTAICPDYQGQSNNSQSDPSASAVDFDIVDGFCYSGSTPKLQTSVPSPEKFFPQIDDYEHCPGVMIDSKGEVILDVIVQFEGDDADLEALGVTIDEFRMKENKIIVYFPVGLLPKVASIPGVIRIYTPGSYAPRLDVSTDMVEGNNSAVQYYYPGLGGGNAIVGILDGGIDWLHEDFIDTSGKTRIKMLWDQTESGIPPSGFYYGVERDSNFIQNCILNQTPKGIDNVGHGSHVAGIAAGDGFSSAAGYKGIAPEANLVVVKMAAWSETAVKDAIRYVAKTSNTLDLPWVINLSWGNPINDPTARDGTSEVEQFIDYIVTSSNPGFGEGRVIVVAAGNDADKQRHASCSGPGTVDLDVSVVPDLYVRDKLAICVLYRSLGVNDAWLKLTAPDNQVYGPVHLGCVSNWAVTQGWVADTGTQTTDGLVRIFHDYFDQSSFYFQDPVDNHPNDCIATVELADGFFNQTGRLYQLRAGTWTIEMGGDVATWDAYIYDYDSLATKIFASYSADSTRTVGSPATADKCIAVGSINSTKRSWTDALGHTQLVDTVDSNYTYPSGEQTRFSSRGPARDGGLKPEIYAPGAFIMSVRPEIVTDTQSPAHSNHPQFIDLDGVHYLTAGTSSAAPHVAGAAALMLSKNPSLSADDVKLILVNKGTQITTEWWNLNVLNALKHSGGDYREPQVEPGATLPNSFALRQNYPNPFNPRTTIEIEVAGTSSSAAISAVQVDIFNILGQRVARLWDGPLSPGVHPFAWDGNDDKGNRVASGVYLYRCVCDGQADTKKMVVLR